MNWMCERESDAGSLRALRKRTRDEFWDTAVPLSRGQVRLNLIVVCHGIEGIRQGTARFVPGSASLYQGSEHDGSLS